MKERTLPRKPAVLSESTQRRLGMYALVAAAAGVGVLALADPAQGKVIYTPVINTRGPNPFPLDLNHDGITDFRLVEPAGGWEWTLAVCQYSSENSYHGCDTQYFGTNAIRATFNGVDAAVLRSGAKIQDGQRFREHGAEMAGVIAFSSHSTYAKWWGKWANGGKGVRNRYLGLKFKINGQVHFDWARVTVMTARDRIRYVVSGYAYETIPGKGIIAGKTKGPDVITLPPDMGTLGLLALGRK